MDQGIIKYLKENKQQYSKESLIAQLKNSGYTQEDIEEGINVVYDDIKDTKESPVAPQGKRFANFIIDLFCYFIFSFILGIVLGITGLYTILGVENWNNTLFGIIVISIFFIFFESIWAKTPGKFITKTKVVMVIDKSKPGLGVIIIRTLCRFIPFEAFSFLTGHNPIGWHDKLSKTMVIDDK